MQTPEDLIKLAAEEGYELSDDDLAAVSGGGWLCDSHVCEGYVHYVHC